LEKSGLYKEQRNFDPSMLPSRKTVTLSLVSVFVGMTEAGVQGPFTCKQMKREPLGADPVRSIMLLSDAAASMSATKGVYVLRTEPIIRCEMFSKFLVWACEKVVNKRSAAVFVVTWAA